jgi:uncharacterized membrane protein
MKKLGFRQWVALLFPVLLIHISFLTSTNRYSLGMFFMNGFLVLGCFIGGTILNRTKREGRMSGKFLNFGGILAALYLVVRFWLQYATMMQIMRG